MFWRLNQALWKHIAGTCKHWSVVIVQIMQKILNPALFKYNFLKDFI